MIKTARISSTVLIVAAIVIVVNILSENYFFRIDLTEGREYTLSRATRNILGDLENPVTITAYFSKDLPPNIGNISGNLKDMLIEYGRRSDGMVVYRFVNPNEKEELEQEAVKNGIQPVMINVREKDQVRQQKAYMGAVISIGEEKETIPFFQPGAAMEYALSTAIKKLSVKEKPSIAYITGHGEPGLNEMIQAATELGVLYSVEQYTQSDTADIPSRFTTAMIVRPSDTIPPGHFARLDNFLARGGRLFIAFNRVDGDFTSVTGRSVSTGIEEWLQQKGLNVQDNFVIDASCSAVTVQQQQGNFIMSTQVSFPYLPVITKFTGHSAVSGLESVTLQFASPISYTGDSTRRFTPIAFTSDKSGSLRTPLYFDVQKQWTENDFPMSSLPVAGILEGNLSGNSDSRMIIVTDGDFAVNGPQRGNQLPPDNVSLLVNSVDWLTDETGLIELRTKEITSRPIKELSDGTRSLLKWINFLAPMLLMVVYGIVRMQMNRSKRLKRMEVSYE